MNHDKKNVFQDKNHTNRDFGVRWEIMALNPVTSVWRYLDTKVSTTP